MWTSRAVGAALWTVSLCTFAACEAEQIGPVPDTRPADADADTAAPVDTADTTVDTGGDTRVSPYRFCGEDAPEPECPQGQFCETTAFVCVDCVGLRARCTDAGREVCEAPNATGIGQLTGGFYAPDPCGGGQVCVPDGIFATCQERLCTAGESSCADGRVRRCNDFGTLEEMITCGAGQACYEGACENIRHNVLLIFDTSGSMHDYIDGNLTGSPISCEERGTPCVAGPPQCDDPVDPLTLLTLSKTVFSDSIEAAIGGFAQFALQRFPQRESGSNIANCWLGWYAPSPRITGDDDARETVPGGWFDAHLREAFVVPFPVRNSLNNSEALLEWLDHAERLTPSAEPCLVHADCGTGRCGNIDGQSRCFYHGEDELRAGGETPLGKSLFYAGEYFRRFVHVDGKPCQDSVDCGSAGYVCRDGACLDPYAKCRDDYIILFTDGEESEHGDTTAFFNPVVQAKRLAYGLGCETDADCRGEATCEAAICTAPTWDLPGTAPQHTGDGFGALSKRDGSPLSIRTTVITLESGSTFPTNRQIAAAGGGANLDVSAGDPAAFRTQLRRAMSPDFKCQPDDL